MKISGRGSRNVAQAPADRSISRRALMAAAVVGLAVAGFNAGEAIADDAPKVAVTIKPVHSLVAGVLGDVATPSLVLDGRQSPHGTALKPSQVSAINGSDMVIFIGAGVESFMPRILEAMPKSVTSVAVSDFPELRRLEIREGAAFEAHDHSHHAHGDGHDHGHDHGHHAKKDHKHGKDHDHKHHDKKAKAHGHDHDHGHKGHSHKDHGHKGHKHDDHAHKSDKSAHGKDDVRADHLDGHLWLDPENARQIVRHLTEKFSKRWPEHAATFKANSADMIEKLDSLDAQLATKLKPFKDKRFIVFHDGYQYFETHFGLQAAGAITVNPEVPPGAKRLKELRDRIGKDNVACVFAEPQFKARVVSTVIEGTKARSGILDPLGADLEPGAALYSKLMTALADEFATCLGGAA